MNLEVRLRFRALRAGRYLSQLQKATPFPPRASARGKYTVPFALSFPIRYNRVNRKTALVETLSWRVRCELVDCNETGI